MKLLSRSALLTLGLFVSCGALAFAAAPKARPKPAAKPVAAAPPAPAKVFLRYLWREGESLGYRSQLNLRFDVAQPVAETSEQGTLSRTASERHKVTDVLDDLLQVTTEINPTVVNLRFGDQTLRRHLSAEALDLELSPEGEVAGYGRRWGQPWEGEGEAGLRYRDPMLLLALAPCGKLPSQEVKVGDAWTGKAKVEIPLLLEPEEVQTSSRILEIGRFQGRPTVKVRTTWSAPLELAREDLSAPALAAFSLPEELPTLKGEFRAELTWSFDYVNGRLLQLTGPAKLELLAEGEAQGDDVPPVLVHLTAQGSLRTILLP